jgi:hypothetical protein
MLPNLGWYPDACERHIHTLREDILVHQSQIFEDTADVVTPEEAIEIKSLNDNNIELDEIESDFNLLALETRTNSAKYLQGLQSLLQRRDTVDTLMGSLQIVGVKNFYPTYLLLCSFN